MEIWKPIPDYEEFYEASSLGRIRSKDRIRGNGIPLKGRVLKPNTERCGYLQVALYRPGEKHKFLKVHRLVASAFLPNPQHKEQVNHKNGIRDDNRLENLEWCTCSENHRHAFAVLGKQPSRAMLGKPHPKRKLSKEQIEQIIQDGRSQITIAKEYGVSQQTISNIKTGKLYKSW